MQACLLPPMANTSFAYRAPSGMVREVHESTASKKLNLWLLGRTRTGIIRRAPLLPRAQRWDALDTLCAMPGELPACTTLRLVGLIEMGSRGSKRLRCAAAIALIRLTAGCTPKCCRVQAAHARALALALPPALARPHTIEGLLSTEKCTEIMAQAEAFAAEHGWGSLHRRYPTVDLRVNVLPCGTEIEGEMRARALPLFASLFGAGYGPPSELGFKDLFVAKYEADGGQTGAQALPCAVGGAEQRAGRWAVGSGTCQFRTLYTCHQPFTTHAQD